MLPSISTRSSRRSPAHGQNASLRRRALGAALLASVLVTSVAAVPAGPAASSSSSHLLSRHGDHEHEADEPSAALLDVSIPPAAAVESAVVEAMPVKPVATASEPVHAHMADEEEHMHEHTPDPAPHEHAHADEHHDAEPMHKEPHSHGHSHGHAHHASPATYVPPIPANGELIKIPPITGDGTSGHHHGGGGAAAAVSLNESHLFQWSGPLPLSYIEYDFSYGLGADEELRRFTDHLAPEGAPKLMGSVNGIFRTLVDEGRNDDGGRKRLGLEQDIKNQLSEGGRASRHRGLMMLHVLGSILACFVLLPIALTLKAAHSTLTPLFSLLYLATLAGSIFLSMLYEALTPRLYPANAHTAIGHAVFWLSLLGLGSDVFRLLLQIYAAVRGAASASKRGLSSFGASSAQYPHDGASDASRSAWSNALQIALGRHVQTDAEKCAMLAEEQEHMLDRAGGEDVEAAPMSYRDESPAPRHSVHFSDARDAPARQDSSSSSRGIYSPTGTLVESMEARRDSVLAHAKPWTGLNSPDRSVSPREQMRLAKLQKPAPTSKARKLRTTLRFVHVVLNRSLPIIGFVAAYTGLAVYTGTCRGNKTPGCAAHGIKGGIFFWYGLLTWARYLGAYADIGWAWNKKPSPSNTKRVNVASWRQNAVSAEFVECLVIFVYGASNTWMERFGSAPGDPYTIKQIQHISIAVMFWFAGLVGMLLETKRIRNLLSFSAALNHASAVPVAPQRLRRSTGLMSEEEQHRCEATALVESQAPPPSYTASFNPFPALVIGVTGIAMSAHHQDYQYEVAVHALWGNLLGGFAVLRCLTYFFLWLRPPTSILPSRPPTEALAGFALACGGLVFMLSSEEVSFAAMRAGYDDLMAIMNLSVAIISLIFCFAAALLVLKGWALRREFRLTQEDGHDVYIVGERIRLESIDVRRSTEGRNTTGVATGPARISMTAAEQPYHAPAPRKLHATVSDDEPVFVLQDDDDDAEDAREGGAARQQTDRLLTSSPPLIQD